MEPREEPLSERLLAQQEAPQEKLARYRRDVDTLLAQVRRQKRWMDGVRAVLTTLAVVVLSPLAVFFGLVWLYLLVGGNSLLEAWCPAAAALLCAAGAAAILRWFFRRRSDDLLVEVQRLQTQGLELQETLQRQGRHN
jgi:hypothetical protein